MRQTFKYNNPSLLRSALLTSVSLVKTTIGYAHFFAQITVGFTLPLQLRQQVDSYLRIIKERSFDTLDAIANFRRSRTMVEPTLLEEKSVEMNDELQLKDMTLEDIIPSIVSSRTSSPDVGMFSSELIDQEEELRNVLLDRPFSPVSEFGNNLDHITADTALSTRSSSPIVADINDTDEEIAPQAERMQVVLTPAIMTNENTEGIKETVASDLKLVARELESNLLHKQPITDKTMRFFNQLGTSVTRRDASVNGLLSAVLTTNNMFRSNKRYTIPHLAAKCAHIAPLVCNDNYKFPKTTTIITGFLTS